MMAAHNSFNQTNPNSVKLARPQLSEALLINVPLLATPDEIRHFESTLSRDELARSNRFVFPELRTRFIKCRGALRAILGGLCKCPASDIQFRYEQWGKPQLQSQNSLLHFNVSHSADQALIAIANSTIGVDLELPTRKVNYSAIASQVLSNIEKTAWDELPVRERETTIMQLWVCKEALLKAMGLGIAEGLTQVSFTLPISIAGSFRPAKIDAALQLHIDDDGTCGSNHWIDTKAWQMRMVDTNPDGFAALAMSTAIKHVSVHNFV
jgi:phosphopantetheinyl transferase